MKKIIEILHNKIVLASILTIVFVSIIGIGFFINEKKLTKLEKIKIEETCNKISNYLDEIYMYEDDSGKYINFAAEYLYNENNKEDFSLKEVLDVINDTFDIDYGDEELSKIGISSRMLDKNIVYDNTSNLFKYKQNKTQIDIANTEIVKYELKKIKKINKKKFEVTLEKYVVENPYEILNYYNDYNMNQSDSSKRINTDDIVKYLKGKENVKVIKDLINKDNIEIFGKIDGSIKITFVIEDNKLKIK